MWWGGGWWPVALVMGVVMILCVAMMARMMGHGMSGSRGDESERQDPGVAERILANRLASGEIDVEEYEQLRDALRRTRESART